MNYRCIVSKDKQRTAITLQGDSGDPIGISYEPVQHALRVSSGDMHRLFFYEPDELFGSRGALINEYGLPVARLQVRQRNKGQVQVADIKYTYSCDEASGRLLLEHPHNATPSVLHYASLRAADGRLDTDLFRAVVLLLAWSVGAAVLQA